MPYVFDGRKFALEKEQELKLRVDALINQGVTPRFAPIRVGKNEASLIYLRLKAGAATRLGIQVQLVKFKDSPVEEIIKTIKSLNNNNSIHGIMVQLPLPDSLIGKSNKILSSIAQHKDVDGLLENSSFKPATVKAILYSIKEAENNNFISLNSASICVVGATGMVGKPLVRELKRMGCQVVGCDETTLDIQEKTLQADLLISATGMPGLIKADMVKEGSVIIDIGAPEGDVDFDSVCPKVAFITPVPGGIGPMTVISLMENIVEAAESEVK